MDKELKNMQILEEEKTKLDAFCEQSLKNVSNEICQIINHIVTLPSSLFIFEAYFQKRDIQVWRYNAIFFRGG